MSSYGSLGALFLILCFSGPAFGDWQGTVWNNSPEQAEKTFRVPHRTAMPAEVQNYFGEARIAFDSYQVGDLAFHKGMLLFSDGKLYAIWMELKDPSLCDKLIAVLRVAYGEPAEDKTYKIVDEFPPDRTVRWYDQKQRNEINVFYTRYPAEMYSDDDCKLKYAPFIVPSPGQLLNSGGPA
jgi:hypothetical protein